MSDQYSNRNFRESIEPRGRPSIHNHLGCPFNREYIMGRHGLIQNKYIQADTRSLLNQDDDGKDEVDNVMSKYAYPIDIQQKNKNKLQRSSSLDLSNEDLSSDGDKLSKSLPTFLQQKPYCSDSFSEDEEYSTQRTNFSSQSYGIRNSESWNESNASNLSTHSQSMRNDTTSKKYSVYQWLILPVVLVIVCIICYSSTFENLLNKFYHETKIIVPSKYDKVKLYYELSDLGKKYSVDDNIILQLRTGISLISEKQDTDSFMFVYNSESSTFNPDIFNDFVNKVASITARYLRNHTSSVHHVVIDSSRLAVEDSDELINKYKIDVAQSGVLLFKRIDTLPSSLAMALHYYCDEYNPLVKNSAIFSTLDLAYCSDKKSTHAHIEKCLTKKWHSIPIDNIGPLLTRVVSVVIDVSSVF